MIKPHKGEIWHLKSEHAQGHKSQNEQYYLVISPRELATKLDVSVCIPVISGGVVSSAHGVTIRLDGGSTNTGSVEGLALCYQLQSLKLTDRNARYAATVAPRVMDEVLSQIVDLIDPR